MLFTSPPPSHLPTLPPPHLPSTPHNPHHLPRHCLQPYAIHIPTHPPLHPHPTPHLPSTSHPLPLRHPVHLPPSLQPYAIHITPPSPPSPPHPRLPSTPHDSHPTPPPPCTPSTHPILFTSPPTPPSPPHLPSATPYTFPQPSRSTERVSGGNRVFLSISAATPTFRDFQAGRRQDQRRVRVAAARELELQEAARIIPPGQPLSAVRAAPVPLT